MDFAETMKELEAYGNEQTKKVLARHGAREPFFGVKIGDLQKIRKRIGKVYELALELFETGNSDAMYLASMVADETRMTKKDLRKWARKSYWYMLSQYAVAQLAAETKHGWALGLEWIDAPKENIISSGWSTLSNIISTKSDEELDTNEIKLLMKRIEASIHSGQNREKHAMCGFVICVGAYMPSLHKRALALGKRIGKVEIDVATPGCTAPDILEDIEKVEKRGRIGKKRKRARC